MLSISDEQFDQIISEAMDSLPPDRIAGLQNIAITYEDKPSAEQRKNLQLRGDQTLYGLYEGTPLTQRPAADSILGSGVRLPDRITLFKLPITDGATTIEQVKEQVRHTLWHEIAHYYGLDHKRIHELE